MQIAQRAALDRRKYRSRRRNEIRRMASFPFLIIILIVVINERIMVMTCDRKEQLPESRCPLCRDETAVSHALTNARTHVRSWRASGCRPAHASTTDLVRIKHRRSAATALTRSDRLRADTCLQFPSESTAQVCV